MSENIELSAIVPVCDLFDTTGELARAYLELMKQTGKRFELVYVLDGEHVKLLEQITRVAASDERVRIVQLAKNFGEATALAAGFAYTSGDIILTLPAYSQVQTAEIPVLIDELARCDLAVSVRVSAKKTQSSFKTLRRKLFHALVRAATGESFDDMGCGVRAFNRRVAEEIPLYGDQYRFFPLLAARRGFRVNQVQIGDTDLGRTYGAHGPRAYLARLLDIFAIIFLSKFTKKPLRFFGTIGSIVFSVGAVFLAYIIIERLFFGVALADRPALLLTSLLVVLGLQIFALGLLGELIIFTHGKDMKEYTIERIVN